MPRRCIVLLIGSFVGACASDTATLAEPTDGSDAGTEAQSDAGTPEGCPVPADVERTNAREAVRLGLRTAALRVVGTIAGFDRAPDDVRARLRVEEVRMGPFFLVGTEVSFSIEPSEPEALPVGTRWLVGFDGEVPNLYVKAMAPLDEAPPEPEWSGYRGDLVRDVVVARVVGVTTARTGLEVVRSVFHRPPGRALAGAFAARWDRTLPLPYPALDDATYLVSTASVQDSAPFDAEILDVRPYTAEAEARVMAGLETAVPPLDPALLAFAGDFGRAWTFHRAPHVVATRVHGRVFECCTGAGGTYVGHEVEAVLKGPAPSNRLLRGGHAYYSDERCDSSRVLALADWTDAPPDLPLGCSMQAIEAAPPGVATSRVLAELPDGSPESRRRAETWVGASPPMYLLRPDRSLGPADVSTLRPPLDFNAPLGVAEAILAARLTAAVVDVRRVEARAWGYEITLDVSVYGTSLPARLATSTCVDPRLLRVGARWLALPVHDYDGQIPLGAEGIEAGATFLASGVLLPDRRWTRELISGLRL